MELSLDIVRYCAEEVERQQDSPTAVFWMVNAWCRAMDAKLADKPLTIDLVESWGKLVEPHENEHGFRRVAVRVGTQLCPDWQELPALLATWIGLLPIVSDEEAYYRFEMIHPFRDGNGRVGKIIYAYLKNSLSKPTMPPNFFNCSNP